MAALFLVVLLLPGFLTGLTLMALFPFLTSDVKQPETGRTLQIAPVGGQMLLNLALSFGPIYFYPLSEMGWDFDTGLLTVSGIMLASLLSQLHLLWRIHPFAGDHHDALGRNLSITGLRSGLLRILLAQLVQSLVFGWLIFTLLKYGLGHIG